MCRGQDQVTVSDVVEASGTEGAGFAQLQSHP